MHSLVRVQDPFMLMILSVRVMRVDSSNVPTTQLTTVHIIKMLEWHVQVWQCTLYSTVLMHCDWAVSGTHRFPLGVMCQEGDLRLVGGLTHMQGRVEICIGQVWGTVCDDFWGENNAKVVCRQLGFGAVGMWATWVTLDHVILYVYTTGASTTYQRAWFGRGTGPIHLDFVHCSGNEQNLLDCNPQTADICGHNQDAGVACPCESYLQYALLWLLFMF